jgi:hypothetical protein
MVPARPDFRRVIPLTRVFEASVCVERLLSSDDRLTVHHRLTRLTRGVAFYCHGGDLTSCIMESYLAGKRRKAYLA